jgi:hypothetical protein
MNVFLDVLREIRSMFVADARMTAAVVALVGLAGLSAAAGLPAGLVGGLLVVGTPALVAVSVLGAGRRRR